MTIGEMHDMMMDIINQGQGGYFPPEVRDRALNSASSDKFGEEKQLFESTQKISGDLGSFKTPGTITFTAGFGSLPDGYDYATNASTINNKKVEIVPDSEWVDRINDPFDIPTVTAPICAIRDQIQIMPDTVASMYLYYLRFPATMEFVYSEDSEGNITPNPGSSTDCDWPVSAHVDIVLRALVYLGVPLSDELSIRLKTLKKQTENV